MSNIPARLRILAAGTALLVCFCTAALAAGADVASIRPAKGLVLTSTVRATYVVSAGGGARSYSGMDVEEWDSVADASADVIDYQIRISAPASARANTDLGRFVLHRRVRREDIAQATRINLFYSSQDPEMFAGQTFLETSVKALGLLKSGVDVPYVIAVIDGEDPLGPMGALIRQVGAQPGNGKPGTSPLAGFASLFSAAAAHTYYRGNLHRVESAPVMLPVLLDGAAVKLPALHAQGTIVNGDKSIQVQFWWLDSRIWPLTLKWHLAFKGYASSQQITRIDLPPQAGNGPGGGGRGTSAMADELRKSCHLELSGIYFNTGSASLLPESQPALRQLAQVVRQSKGPVLEVQGHTDNIGTAQFNRELSQQRAEAVRQVLVSQFGIPPAKLTARGFGFTRPVDTNDTVVGRAHNRRVELACPGGAVGAKIPPSEHGSLASAFRPTCPFVAL
jgi:outer membrane protein OmpA-like peptidoglycan-associated protein